MKISRILAVIMLCLTLAGVAEAKWWIFGQANDEVSISYLYLNDISYDESGEKVTIYRDMLTNGEIVLRGKARVGKGKIGGASISLDNRANWKEAQFTTDGAFEYRFRPELGKTYIMYVEVVDTAGKSNDIESTRKELIVAEGSFQNEVRAALDALIAAYRAEDPATFMRNVSEDFAGDSAILDRAIRQDFSLFDNIDLRYTLNNVASGNGGLFVAITFSRQITSARDGKTYSDKGTTEFVFKLTDRGPKVFSMKNPLIFGLSDSEDVATGTVNSGNTDPVIAVNDDGTIRLQQPGDDQGGNDSTVESGYNVTINSSFHPPQGFDFVMGEADPGTGASFFITGGETGSYAYGWLGNGHAYKDLGSVDIDSISEAPADGYISDTGIGINFYVGHTYAFKTATGKYALMEVKSTNMNYEAYQMTMRIDYKYQPNGSTQF